jgi:hypothetical protein
MPIGNNGWISTAQLAALGDAIKTEYGGYFKFAAGSR